MNPMQPWLPIFAEPLFVFRVASEADALLEAKRRIDQLLARTMSDFPVPPPEARPRER